MKCEHEGCEKEANVYWFDLRACATGLDQTVSASGPRFCPTHLAAWLRAKADDVEGVRNCTRCDGEGYVGTDEEYEKCRACHGTGRVAK